MLNLPVSDSNLEVAISVSGRDGAQFGAGLYDAAVKKRLLLPVWAKKDRRGGKTAFHHSGGKAEGTGKTSAV